MLFDDWYGLLRVLIVGTSAYAGLVALLRLTGKRTLSKINAFDLIVTVALGSTLATVLLSSDVALAEGMLALSLLCALQYVVAYASTRVPRFQALIKAEPSLLYFRGQFLSGAMRSERVSEEEILAAIRAQGIADPAGADAVVLETDGSFSVVSGGAAPAIGSLRYVRAPGDGGANSAG
jgi:uncharacterized membrane protein YcaP (DUF421 family)